MRLLDLAARCDCCTCQLEARPVRPCHRRCRHPRQWWTRRGTTVPPLPRFKRLACEPICEPVWAGSAPGCTWPRERSSSGRLRTFARPRYPQLHLVATVLIGHALASLGARARASVNPIQEKSLASVPRNACTLPRLLLRSAARARDTTWPGSGDAAAVRPTVSAALASAPATRR